jgi:hypothetical protein
MTEQTSRPAAVSTLPLLAEDVLLLLFDPQNGVFRGEGSTLFHILAGAVLTELAINNQVEINDRTTLRGREVRVMSGNPPADPLLLTTWERIEKRPTDVHSLILEIGPPMRAAFIDRLAHRGVIRTEKKKFLGFIPDTAISEGDASRRDALMSAVRAVLLEGAEPEARVGAVVALLSASGQLPAMDREIPWSGAVHTRGMDIQKGGWGAEAAAESVARTAAAILASSLFVSITLPTIQGR